MSTTYDPEIYLESTVRILKEYTENGFNQAIVNDQNTAAGLEVYDVVMEFPPDEMILDYIPNKKSIIHFELDNIEDHVLGFGRNVAQSVYDSVSGTITEREGRRHILNFDVGIWSWDKSGGITARLRARQILTNLFTGGMAIERLRDWSDGDDGKVEIISHTDGHFLTEYINDVRVFRQVNSTLVLRVFSRSPVPYVTPTVEEIDQDLELVIDPGLEL